MTTGNSNEQAAKGVDVDELIRNNSSEINSLDDIDLLIEKIGDAKYVMLGEASHGTHEYYTWRTIISRRLIEEKGFSFIAVEGDWPDCYNLNRYVKNYANAGKSAYDVLHKFNRWPTWMWANWEIIALAEWMFNFNKPLEINKKVGFYGLDVYSLWESLDAVIKYLDHKDPDTLRTAEHVLKCFEPYSEGEGQSYGQASLTLPAMCEDEVIDLLMRIRKNMHTYNHDHEGAMNAQQNAHVIVNAEKYYRAMVRPGPKSWNIRDHHMVDTLNRLTKFHGPKSKAIIWEHNTHIGDARATDMSSHGMANVGQFVNEQHKDDGVYSIGFGSYQGGVIASNKWGGNTIAMDVPPAMAGSWEDILHKLDAKDRIVYMTDEMKDQLGKKKIDHRAIGVVYHPRYEQAGNYVPSRIPHRYDAFIYLDKTSPVHPVHTTPDGHLVPETFPFGV